MSVFTKKQVEMWTHLNTAHISTVFFLLSEMSSLPENSLVSLPRIDVYVSPCVTEIQVVFLDEVAVCDKCQQFSIVLPSTWVLLTPRQDGFSCNAI